ncbi:MAG TPA: DNA-binding protein [Lentisphaeria bacterium]|nr:DNA-binding protein [Lentisphaeria bacterium]
MEKLNNTQAAEYLGIEPRTLHNWRCLRRYKIPYLKLGSKVIYRKSDLDAWLATKEVHE